MSIVDDIGYGRQFEGFYDRIFPRDASADLAAAKLASIHPGGGTLEFGAGTGRIAIPLAALAGEVVAVDSSPEMLDQLRRNVKESDAAVTPVHGDIRTYTDEERYGLVYCVCATLSMILDPAEQQEVIHRAAERLAPGGKLVVETHNKDGVLALHEGKRRTSFFVPYPEPDTGLLTYSTLSPDNRLWQASHVWFDNGSSHTGTELSKLTSPGEVDGFAAEAGLEPVSRATDWQDTPYAEAGPMFVAVYTKAAA
jgi:SAM-dependent methyltransferase